MSNRAILGALASTCLLGAVTGVTPVAGQAAFEKPAVLRAADLAPAELPKGPRFQVDETVTTDGLLARFTIKSDFGPFEAQGPGMLAVRVAEIRALDTLSHVEKTDVFQKALAESAKRTGQSLKTAVTNPVETIKGLPEGVGRFFERVGRGVVTGAQKAGDYISEKQGQPGGASSGDVAAATGQAASNVGENVIGYDDARRRVAKELRVDPLHHERGAVQEAGRGRVGAMDRGVRDGRGRRPGPGWRRPPVHQELGRATSSGTSARATSTFGWTSSSRRWACRRRPSTAFSDSPGTPAPSG